MVYYIIRRILVGIPTILVMSFVIFATISMAPGDPMAEFGANPEVPAEVRENIKKSLGLDQPWPVRYVKWFVAMTQGEWGYSYSARTSVIKLIGQRLPQTLMVVGLSYLIAVIVAVPLGVMAAARPKSIFSRLTNAVALSGISLPTFFTGLVMILIFSVGLRMLPMIYDTTLSPADPDFLSKQIKQSIMPVTVLALFSIGALTRYVRSAMLDNLPMDYVRTARAKGMTEWPVIIKHVLRNSLIPVVTLVALGVPAVFTGAIITEQIFRVQGIGELLITSIQKNDTPVVMAITFLYGILVVIFQLLADLTYGALDPRIKLS
ncbi:MAG TPA: ABC transporter permease [Thermoflexales bacterium]|nr:ABC transporter permease [Thermoflexales bacterium]HQW34537.1 ABC transporter permease [Thermoflexales bacterium]HQZ22237.1 ABC transporter permease [Thermoflexales bacterium]HRA00255.1 ABC transporter permease [Thermoflexales bacterium]